MSMGQIQSGMVESQTIIKKEHSSQRRKTSQNNATATQMTFGMLLAAFSLQPINLLQVQSEHQNTGGHDQHLMLDPLQEKTQGQLPRQAMLDEHKQTGNLISTTGDANASAPISATYSELATTAPLDVALRQFESKHGDSKLADVSHHTNDQGKKDSLLKPGLTGGSDQMGAIGVEQSMVSSMHGHTPTTRAISLSPGQQIAEHVRVTLESGDREATLRLEPAELGKVRIHLSLDNGQVHLSIQAEQQDTNRLLQQKISDLRANLDAQGVKVGDLSVVEHHGKSANGTMRDQMLHQVKTTLGSASGDLNREFTGHTASGFGGHSFGQHGHGQRTSEGQLAAPSLAAVSTRSSYATPTVSSNMWVSSQGWLTGIDAYV